MLYSYKHFVLEKNKALRNMEQFIVIKIANRVAKFQIQTLFLQTSHRITKLENLSEMNQTSAKENNLRRNVDKQDIGYILEWQGFDFLIIQHYGCQIQGGDRTSDHFKFRTWTIGWMMSEKRPNLIEQGGSYEIPKDMAKEVDLQHLYRHKKQTMRLR